MAAERPRHGRHFDCLLIIREMKVQPALLMLIVHAQVSDPRFTIREDQLASPILETSAHHRVDIEPNTAVEAHPFAWSGHGSGPICLLRQPSPREQGYFPSQSSQHAGDHWV